MARQCDEYTPSLKCTLRFPITFNITLPSRAVHDSAALMVPWTHFHGNHTIVKFAVTTPATRSCALRMGAVYFHICTTSRLCYRSSSRRSSSLYRALAANRSFHVWRNPSQPPGPRPDAHLSPKSHQPLQFLSVAFRLMVALPRYYLLR